MFNLTGMPLDEAVKRLNKPFVTEHINPTDDRINYCERVVRITYREDSAVILCAAFPNKALRQENE